MRIPILVLALAPFLAGCGGGGGSSPASTAAPVASSSPADPLGFSPAQVAEEQALLDELAQVLQAELGLDAERAARARALIAASWERTRLEVARRIESCESLEEEAVLDLLEARQHALDVELAAIMTPAEREAFAALGGRHDQEEQQ